MFKTNSYEIRWLGWCKEYNRSKNIYHDKIWGWMEMKDGRVFCFHGRRGKTLQFKEHYSVYDVRRVQQEKSKKHYLSLTEEEVKQIVGEEFLINLEINFMSALLGETIKPK